MIRFILLLVATVLGNFLYVVDHFVHAPITGMEVMTIIGFLFGYCVTAILIVACVGVAVFCSDEELP